MTERIWRRYDWWLLGFVVLLITGGIAMIASATRGDPVVEDVWIDQSITALAGLVVMVLVSAFDYTLLKGLSVLIYPVILVMLVLVLFIGKEQNFARRWFDLGLFDLQPGELAKLGLTITLASFIARAHGRQPYLVTILQTFLLVAPYVFLILLQPNLSTALTLVFIWLVIIFAGGIERQHVLILLLMTALIVAVVVQLPFFQGYQLNRLRLLFGLVDEPGAAYQSEQALIALGNGGLWGQGYARGAQTQLRFYPARHTDFIFSAIGEELGFVGATLFIVLLMLVILRTLRAAWLARDLFGRLVCVGIAATLYLQTYINLGMQVGLLPVTGVVLPFVSYGRSNLITVMVAIGLVQSVAMRYKKLEF